MFGDLMNNMQEKQNEMKAKLSQIPVHEELEGIKISGNASREVENINIPDTLLSSDRKEELEDLLSVAMQNWLVKVSQAEANASQSMLNDLLPGMGGMFGQ